MIKIQVEIEYLKFLLKYLIRDDLQENVKLINKIYDIIQNNPNEEIEKIYNIEKSTNHDVQAIVQYLKQQVPTKIIPFVHLVLHHKI